MNVTRTFLYSIYDNIALEWGPLFEATNPSTAWRNYKITMERQNPIVTNDFQLYEIGALERHEATIGGSFYDNPQIVDFSEVKNDSNAKNN